MLNLGDVLRGAAVSNSDTARQMEYIDIDLIDEDPRNFYELRGLDELAANIELCGLQQPLLVRSNPEAPDRVIIVSGHRRRAAIRKLVDGGREDLRRIPCLREVESSSKALQELRLIFANSDNRNLTSAEISKQAEQVTKLLYELKEEGVEFSGRMRDHVAEACKVSKTKIARLKVIREGLISNMMPAWERGDIAESVAYRLAQESPNTQLRFYARHGRQLAGMTEWQVNSLLSTAKAPPKEQKEANNSEKAKVSEYLDEREKEDARFLQAMRDYGFDWLHSYLDGTADRRSGIEAFKRGPAYSHAGFGHSECDMQCMPQYFAICVEPNPEIKRTWTEVWDAMAVIALERVPVHDEDLKPARQSVFNGWTPGATPPSTPCDCVVVFAIDDKTKMKRLCWWDGTSFRFKAGGEKIEIAPIKYTVLPLDEEGEING